jgi:hypothetical protein
MLDKPCERTLSVATAGISRVLHHKGGSQRTFTMAQVGIGDAQFSLSSALVACSGFSWDWHADDTVLLKYSNVLNGWHKAELFGPRCFQQGLYLCCTGACGISWPTHLCTCRNANGFVMQTRSYNTALHRSSAFYHRPPVTGYILSPHRCVVLLSAFPKSQRVNVSRRGGKCHH